MIPKIIHYCWLSDNPIPEEMNRYVNGWKEILTDYEFVKWDFNRFKKESSLWVSEAFDAKKYAFAADYIRLYAVYNYGGIYMDMDIEVIKDFGPLLEQEYMLAIESEETNDIEAGCFGAQKGNTYIGKCLEYYNDRSFYKKDGTMDTTPLPKVMSEVMKKNNFELLLYGSDYFTVKSYKDGSIVKTDNSYTIHHFAGSWLNDELKQVLIIKRDASDRGAFWKIIARVRIVPYAIVGLVKERGIKGMLKYYICRVKQYVGDRR